MSHPRRREFDREDKTMQARFALLALVGALTVATLLNGRRSSQPADAAAQFSNLRFSTEMTGDFRPAGQTGIEFSSDNNGIFVTFRYTGLEPGTVLSRVVRVNGGEYNYDKDPFQLLTCCPKGGDGAYGFRIVKIDGSTGELPGGAYDVLIFANGGDQPVLHGGFGIRGTSGTDTSPTDNEND